MKNIIVSGLMIAALTTVSSVALAEGAQVKLPADVAACMNACLSGTTCAPQGGCDQRVSALEAELADLKKKLFPKRTNVKPQVDRVKQLQEQLAALTARTDRNEAEIARVAKKLDEETARLDALTKEVEALSGRMKLVEERLDAINASLAAIDGSLKAHDGQLDDHNKRLEKLELAPPTIKVGFHAGFIGLHAFGSGTDYTAVPVTASLTFPISKRVTVFTEAGIALSGDRYAVGTVLHGAAQYHFDQHWSIDGGVSSVWAGFNSHLKVAQASFLGDVGPTFTYGVFTARGSVMAGPAFEPSPRGASFALGGMLTAGVVLP